jgi:RNA-directed DNA polymerase
MSGPQATYEWKQLPWRKLEVAVFKLQKRIYKASQAGDIRRVHQLQRLLLKSQAAQLLAVRRVTQDNQGKNTAGIDGIKSLTPPQRLTVAVNFESLPSGQPTRRVWIPKPGKDEHRPLGIPTLYDRTHQALVKLVLEPEWEAKFEPNSYGFRPGRGAQDAVGAIFNAIRQQPKYVLDADIAKCFDRIDQSALVSKMNTFATLQRQITRWLKAGVVDHGVFAKTEQGTPQGGVLSPLLANIALHGFETHLRDGFSTSKTLGQATGKPVVKSKPLVIRYADDWLVLHRDRAVIEHCQRLAEEWLQDMGLELNLKKTQIAHTLYPEGGKIGFNFLGFAVRQYPVSRYHSPSGQGFKTLIKPSPEAIKSHYRRLADTIRQHQAGTQERMIGRLNPVIAGWSNYYRAVVSKDIFQRLDHLLYIRLARWARRRHPRKSQHWVTRRYWGIGRGQGWVFGSDSGVVLTPHSKVAIVRHAKVRGQASPYDGNWKYWATRRGTYPGVQPSLARRLKHQRGRCQACGLVFMPEALVEMHHLDGNHRNHKFANLSAVHRHCHDQIHGGQHELSQLLGPHDKSPIN